MGENLTIREADEGDIPFILACEADPANEYVHSWDEGTHRGNIADPSFNYLIAEDGQQSPLAYAILKDHIDGRAEWRRIIVAKPGTGIGKPFMRSVIEQKFATGSKSIWLDVYEDNARARHVYGSLGFKETHTEPLPGDPDNILVFMELMRPE